MPDLLLHICCAPCSVACIKQLREEGVEPVGFWYNPNIHPFLEYKTRRDTLRQYAQDMGFVIPSIRLHDGASLGTNQYIIKIRGEEVARGEILVDYYLALEPSNPTGEIDGIETVEPAYGIPSRWILPENKEMAAYWSFRFSETNVWVSLIRYTKLLRP